MKREQSRARRRLPKRLRKCFWDHQFSRLNWREDRDLIISRLLADGNWRDLLWLRRKVNDIELRQWIERRRGRGLSRKQLRYWELVLGIESKQVNQWLRDPGRNVWERRTRVGAFMKKPSAKDS